MTYNEDRLDNLESRLEAIIALQKKDQQRIETTLKYVNHLNKCFEVVNQIEEHLFQALGQYAHSNDEGMLNHIREALELIRKIKKGEE